VSFSIKQKSVFKCASLLWFALVGAGCDQAEYSAYEPHLPKFEHELYVPEVSDLNTEDEFWPNLPSELTWPFRVAGDPRYREQLALRQARFELADKFFHHPASGIRQSLLIGVIDQGEINPGHADLKGAFHSTSQFSARYTSQRHAQFVSGILAARAFNGIGIRGVMGTHSQIIYRETTSSTETANHIRALANTGVTVINISMGVLAPCNQTSARPEENRQCQHPIVENSNVRQAILEVQKKHNTVVVISAGNSNDRVPHYGEVQNQGLIIVGASQNTGRKTSFSNYGGGVSLYVAGESILGVTKNGYKHESGTSFSTPIVAGAAALAIAYLKSNNRPYTARQIKSLIQSSTINKKGLQGLAEAPGHLDFDLMARQLAR
jgi:hypothetical protein